MFVNYIKKNDHLSGNKTALILSLYPFFKLLISSTSLIVLIIHLNRSKKIIYNPHILEDPNTKNLQKNVPIQRNLDLRIRPRPRQFPTRTFRPPNPAKPNLINECQNNH